MRNSYLWLKIASSPGHINSHWVVYTARYAKDTPHSNSVCTCFMHLYSHVVSLHLIVVVYSLWLL